MDTYKVRVGKNGRITLPAAIRKEMNLKTGDLLIVEKIADQKYALRKATVDETSAYELTGSLPKR